MLGDYATCQQIAKTHHCADCGDKAVLVCRWNGPEQSYEVWCRSCGNTDRFVQPESITARWRRDPGSVAIHIANKLESKYGVAPMESKALARLDEQQMTARVNQARWLKDLNPDDRIALAHLAVEYHLDPLMGELVIYEGKPFITINGYIRLAHRQPAFEGLEDRPMTSEERAAYGIKAPIGWMVKVYRRGWRVPVVGTGHADPGNPLRNNPVERLNPQWMARSRAIRQALKLAFPHSLPFDSAEDRGLSIDLETGEILNGHQPIEASEAIDTTATVVVTPEPDPQPIPAEPQATATEPPEPTYTCSDCSKPIVEFLGRSGTLTRDQVAERTKAAYGRQLCQSCAQQAKAKAKGQKHEAAVRGDPQPEPPADDEASESKAF